MLLGVCLVVETQFLFQGAMQCFSKTVTIKKTFQKKNKTKADKLIIFLNPLRSKSEIKQDKTEIEISDLMTAQF